MKEKIKIPEAAKIALDEVPGLVSYIEAEIDRAAKNGYTIDLKTLYLDVLTH